MTFKSLVSAVSEQCQEVKQALASFAYFETWGPDVIGECCRLSSVAEFPPDRIILGPDNGNSHTVYFILEGACRVVQHMHVKMKAGGSREAGGKGELFRWKRYRYSDSGILNSDSKIGGYKSRLLNEGGDLYAAETKTEIREQEEESQAADLRDGEPKQVEEETEVLTKGSKELDENPANGGNTIEVTAEEGEENAVEEPKLEFSQEEVAEVPEMNHEGEHHVKVLEECEERQNETNSVCKKSATPEQDEEGNGEKNPVEEPKLEPSQEEDIEVPEMNYEGDNHLKVSEECKERQNETNSVCKKDALSEKDKEGGNGEKTPKPEFSQEQDTEVPEVKYEPDHHLKVLEECKKRRNETNSVSKKGALPEKVKNVRSVFIQIGFLLKGACFGLEKCENFIMSSTKVKCLKIPQRFLLKHNPCNIWNRIRLFHALYLPKDDRIFENFRTDQLWTEQKKKLSEEIVSARNLHNYTLDSDVPYAIRLHVL